MNVFEQYRISWDDVIEEAIRCHALDITAHDLLYNTTIHDNLAYAKIIYDRLYSKTLLSLAIAIRSKFYQGVEKDTHCYIAHCGFLDEVGFCGEESLPFSIKDVCDKIIHAESMSRIIEDGNEIPTTSFYGRHKDKEWALHISISLFTQGVINWACDQKRTQQPVTPPPPSSCPNLPDGGDAAD